MFSLPCEPGTRLVPLLGTYLDSLFHLRNFEDEYKVGDLFDRVCNLRPAC